GPREVRCSFGAPNAILDFRSSRRRGVCFTDAASHPSGFHDSAKHRNDEYSHRFRSCTRDGALLSRYSSRVWRPRALQPLSASSDSCAVISCRSEEHTSELQSRGLLVCRLLPLKKKERYI